MESKCRFGDERKSPFGSDQQLREVIPGGCFDELATSGHNFSRSKNCLQTEDVVARDAVFDRPHAAGIGGNIAAEAG